MLFALLAIPALPTGRGPIFAPAPTLGAAPAQFLGAAPAPTLEGVVCKGDTTLEEALQQGCTEVTGDLTDGGASGDVNLPNLRYVRGRISVRAYPPLPPLRTASPPRTAPHRTAAQPLPSRTPPHPHRCPAPRPRQRDRCITTPTSPL